MGRSRGCGEAIGKSGSRSVDRGRSVSIRDENECRFGSRERDMAIATRERGEMMRYGC